MKTLGGECKVYNCTTPLAALPAADAFPTGTYTEFNKVIEVGVEDAKENADASDRTSLIDKFRSVGRTVGLSIKIHKDPADTQYLALRAAYIAGTPITLAVCSGDKAVVPLEGFAANWTIDGKPHEEKRKELVIVTFALSVHDYFGDFLDTTP